MFASFRKVLCVAALGSEALGVIPTHSPIARADQYFNGSQVIPFQSSGPLPNFPNGIWIAFQVPQGNGRFGPRQFMGPFYGETARFDAQAAAAVLGTAGNAVLTIGPVR